MSKGQKWDRISGISAVSVIATDCLVVGGTDQEALTWLFQCGNFGRALRYAHGSSLNRCLFGWLAVPVLSSDRDVVILID